VDIVTNPFLDCEVWRESKNHVEDFCAKGSFRKPYTSIGHSFSVPEESKELTIHVGHVIIKSWDDVCFI
jgi:hypothetical protein